MVITNNTLKLHFNHKTQRVNTVAATNIEKHKFVFPSSVALINVHAKPERDQFGELISLKEGRLVLRVEGVWDTICVDTLKEELGHRVCNFLGYK